MPVNAVLIGAGGFGREVLDVVEAHNLFVGEDSTEFIKIRGIVDDSPSEINLKRLSQRDYLYLGTTSELITEINPYGYLLGIGSPKTKGMIATKLEEHGWSPLSVVHPGAELGSVSTFGAGTIICGGVQLSTNTFLGRHVHLNPNATIGHDSIVNDYSSINPGAVISGEVTIGKETLIGAGATILQGLTIGECATVGAAACVTSDVESEKIVIGVPARPQKNE